MFGRWRFQLFVVCSAIVMALAAFVSDAAAQRVIPFLGTGPTELIIFADYSCPPCKLIDAQAEPLLKKLLATGKVKITFVDLPFHRETRFYSKYYLYAANARPDAGSILHVRKKLFEAAQDKKLHTEGDLQAFLQKERIAIEPMDEKSLYPVMAALRKEYRIDQTPTCVIRSSEADVKKLVGMEEMWAGLNELKNKMVGSKK